MWFQNYFNALTGLLFTFPLRYLFTIGEQTYFALRVSHATPVKAQREIWFVVLAASNKISPVLLYSRPGQHQSICLRLRGCYPLWRRIPATFYSTIVINAGARIGSTSISFNPNCATVYALTHNWFRLIPFRSPLLRECSHQFNSDAIF